MSAEFIWTDARVKMLRDMHASGLSFRDIAGALECTRNQAIGKANRMKLRHVAARTPHARLSSVIRPAFGAACQFPHGDVGEADFHFCGAPVQDESSYCPTHHAECHRKPERWEKALGIPGDKKPNDAIRKRKAA